MCEGEKHREIAGWRDCSLCIVFLHRKNLTNPHVVCIYCKTVWVCVYVCEKERKKVGKCQWQQNNPRINNKNNKFYSYALFKSPKGTLHSPDKIVNT